MQNPPIVLFALTTRVARHIITYLQLDPKTKVITPDTEPQKFAGYHGATFLLYEPEEFPQELKDYLQGCSIGNTILEIRVPQLA